MDKKNQGRANWKEARAAMATIGKAPKSFKNETKRCPRKEHTDRSSIPSTFIHYERK
jgi:hypothetical protein